MKTVGNIIRTEIIMEFEKRRNMWSEGREQGGHVLQIITNNEQNVGMYCN